MCVCVLIAFVYMMQALVELDWRALTSLNTGLLLRFPAPGCCSKGSGRDPGATDATGRKVAPSPRERPPHSALACHGRFHVFHLVCSSELQQTGRVLTMLQLRFVQLRFEDFRRELRWVPPRDVSARSADSENSPLHFSMMRSCPTPR